MQRIRPSPELRQRLRIAKSNLLHGLGFEDHTRKKLPSSIIKYLRRRMPVVRRQLEEELAREARCQQAIRNLQRRDSDQPKPKVYGGVHSNGDNPQKRKVELKFEERRKAIELQNRPNREITDTVNQILFYPPGMSLAYKATELYASILEKFTYLEIPREGPVHLSPKQKNDLISLIIRAERELNGAK